MPGVPQPPPPVVGKVTHHTVELFWEIALDKLNEQLRKKGDNRVKVTVQEQGASGDWNTAYTGYGKYHVFDSLKPWSQYRFRIRFTSDEGNSEWSDSVIISTQKEPLTGEHVHRAVLMNNINQLLEILESGNLGSDVHIDTTDKYGFSPLMQASQKGLVDMITALVEHGADVNYQNEAGKTSLMMACYAGQLGAVKELRYSKARYDAHDKGGSTALHWAIDGQNLELIEWIIDDGADIGIRDLNGWTPLLRCAAINGNANVAALLLRQGADINARDKDGKTTLMIAVVNGHNSLVELLMEKGADLSIKNEYGKTAYEMALSMERRRIVKTLEDYMPKK